MAKRRRRKRHKLTEFSDELDGACDRLIAERDLRPLSRAELAVLDVARLIGGVEGNGLHSFWARSHEALRMIESCRLIGAHELADALQTSSWLRTVIERGTDPQGQFRFTDDETSLCGDTEGRVYSCFQPAADIASAYVREHRVGLS